MSTAAPAAHLPPMHASERWLLRACLLLPLAALVLFFGAPMLAIGWRSLVQDTGGIGWGNYAALLDTPGVWRALAHSLLQAFERYYITIAVLVKHGPHTISAAELENLCTLTAQRLTLLHELNAPEFFDKALFKGFIQQLRERRVIWTDDAGKLDFDAALNIVAKDAKVILSREIRHGILKLAPEPKPAAPPPADADKAA